VIGSLDGEFLNSLGLLQNAAYIQYVPSLIRSEYHYCI